MLPGTWLMKMVSKASARTMSMRASLCAVMPVFMSCPSRYVRRRFATLLAGIHDKPEKSDLKQDRHRSTLDSLENISF
jgi:hypothetical protein